MLEFSNSQFSQLATFKSDSDPDHKVTVTCYSENESSPITRFENGQIYENGSYLGNFWINNNGGEPQISINSVPFNKLALATALVTEAFTAIGDAKTIELK